jgi:hypothetical protein
MSGRPGGGAPAPSGPPAGGPGFGPGGRPPMRRGMGGPGGMMGGMPAEKSKNFRLAFGRLLAGCGPRRP